MAPLCQSCSNWISLLALLVSLHCAAAFIPPNAVPVRIDCGATEASVDASGLQWSADYGFVNGTTRKIGSANTAGGRVNEVEQTLRVWTTGESCYNVPVEPGRYLIRLSFCYNNFDGQYLEHDLENAPPEVGVTIEDVLVEQIVFKNQQNATATVTDYIAYSNNQEINLCFMALAASPFVNSIEILPQDTETYFADVTGPDVVLSNWGRINSGGPAFGPENKGDPGYRTWSADLTATDADNWVNITTAANITIPEDYAAMQLGQELFQSCRAAGKPQETTGYNFTGIYPAQTDNKFLVVLYFAEIEPNVVAGQRVMDIWVNGVWLRNIDIMSSDPSLGAGAANTAFVARVGNVPLGVSEDNGYWLGVSLHPHANNTALLPPVICGLELYEVIVSAVDSAATGSDIRIDCGGPGDYQDDNGLLWSKDTGFSSGEISVVDSPGTGLQIAHSLRYFPEPIENCYSVPVGPGRYLVRMYFSYGSGTGYDGNSAAPTFEVYVETTRIKEIKPVAPGFFVEVIAYINDGAADACFIGSTDELFPFVNSFEVLEVDKDSYNFEEMGVDIFLHNYGRVNVGGEQFGETITPAGERQHRVWQAEANTKANFTCLPSADGCNDTVAAKKINGTDRSPNFWPQNLYVSAVVGTKASSIVYTYSGVTTGASLMVYLHFAELNPAVVEGQRIMQVELNGKPQVETIDVASLNGPFSAYDLHIPFNLTEGETTLEVVIKAAKFSTLGPMLNGIEVYGLIPRGQSTESTQYLGMQALKKSMVVPEGLNWQGDPCQPINWVGVTCAETNSLYEITSIEVPNSNISGSLPPEISQLTSLQTLNMSGNNLVGAIPASMTNLSSATIIDLSHNSLNGSIPADLPKISSLLQLLLNDNKLGGQLPASLASPNSALSVNYSGNPYLCGATNLPDCSDVPPSDSPPQVYLPTTEAKGSGGGGSSAGPIVGGIIGAIIAVAVIAGLVIMWRRHSKKKQNEPSTPREELVGSRKPSYYKSTSGIHDV